MRTLYPVLLRHGSRMTDFRFRPALPSTLVTLVLCPCLIWLGLWQLDRAAEKNTLFFDYQRQAKLPAVELSKRLVRSASALQWRAIRARGQYFGPNILLDNRVRDGRVGYDVYTPFQTDAAAVLVARGWIPAPADRAPPNLLARPQGEYEVSGHVGPAPWVGINLKDAAAIERFNTELLRVQHIDFDVVDHVLDRNLERFVVYLDPATANGYDRAWPVPTSGAGKHTAYAVQWFAMACVLLALYIKINLERRPSAES